MKKRVVITGMGAVTPIGIGLDNFWNSALQGKSGVGEITLFDAANYQTRLAAEVKGFNPTDFMLPEIHRKIDRFAQFGVAAAKMAMEDAGINSNHVDPKRNNVPVIIGSGLGGSLFHEEQIFKLLETREPRKVLSSSVPRIAPNAVSAFIAMEFKLKGPNMTISTACSSGGNAISLAAKFIQDGMADIAVTGGVECPISPFTYAAYMSLRVLAGQGNPEKRSPRPFDVNRDGFVLGEAGGILILEEYEKARGRGAKIYAEICGYGSNCGAYHMAAPDPTGEDAAAAMSEAISSAGIEAGKVDYINAHGTATKLNDICEAKAIGQIFGYGKSGPLVSSTKSETGHTIGAAGAIEAIIAAMTVKHDVVPPTINCDEVDPECHINVVTKEVHKKIRYALSNSFGFGSNNSVLLFGKI